MAANNKKFNNGPSPLKQPQYTKILSNIPKITTEIQTEKTTFLWEIKGIANIVKMNLWSTVQCTFEVGESEWNVSLYKSGKNILFAKPLISPNNTGGSYYIKLQVVNPQLFVVHGASFAPDHPVEFNSKEENIWEVLRLSDGIIDQFSSYVFSDTLRLLVEMNVFVPKQLSDL